MTVQISDRVHYDGKVRALTAVDGTGLFVPWEHGVDRFRHGPSSCPRGYHCAYLVDAGELYLSEIYLGLTRMDERRIQLRRGPRLFGKTPQRREHNPSWEPLEYCVTSLRELVPFTGGLLLTSGCIDSNGYQGFQGAIERSLEIHELVFEAGRLLEAIDVSAEAMVFRARPPRSDHPTLDERARLDEWIREHLRFGYGRLEQS